MELTELEKQILLLMKEKRRLPIVRFELHSSKDAELACTALNYVWIRSGGFYGNGKGTRSSAGIPDEKGPGIYRLQCTNLGGWGL